MNPERFLEQFGHLAEAPNGIAKLRELILQLAVRGKLVPQDPTDEPASVLLERIRAEKDRLSSNRKIKLGKLLPELKSGPIPFHLPSTWAWSRLGEIGAIVGGGTPPSGHPEYFSNQDIPWLTPADMRYVRGKFVERGERDISRLGLEKSSAQLMPAGTVLFSSRAPIGYVAIAAKPVATNQGFKSCVPWVMECSQYIFVFLKWAASRIDASAPGTTFREVSGRIVANVLIPVPPPAEQARIVAKVDQLMALCDELEAKRNRRTETHGRLLRAAHHPLVQPRARNELEPAWRRVRDNFDRLHTTIDSVKALRQTILQLAVQGKLVPQDPDEEPASVLLQRIRAEKERPAVEGKIEVAGPRQPIKTEGGPFQLPSGWAFARFNDIVFLMGGVTKGRKLGGREVLLVPYLRVANVQRGYLDLEEMKQIEVTEDELAKYKVFERDLLITEGGDWDKVGRTAIWRGELPVVVHQNHVFKARCVLAEQNEIWLERYLNSTIARDYFAGASKQTTNLASINMTQLRGCVVPVPPLAEQQRIVAKVDQLMTLCDELEAKIQANESTAGRFAEAVVAELAA